MTQKYLNVLVLNYLFCLLSSFPLVVLYAFVTCVIIMMMMTKNPLHHHIAYHCIHCGQALHQDKLVATDEHHRLLHFDGLLIIIFILKQFLCPVGEENG